MDNRYYASPKTLADLFMGAVQPLDEYVKAKLVKRQHHPELPLAILNYTALCQYSQHWDLVTRQCRGLIYNTETNAVVSRPFQKFFSYGEPNCPDVGLTIGTAYDKLDGSLGILYPTGGGSWAVATRGSFTSVPAQWATNHWIEHYEGLVEPEEGHTYLFEIIFPENRIVLDYQGLSDLFLLAVLDNSTGKDVSAVTDYDWPGQKVRELKRECTIEEAMQIADRENAEGFVWVQWGSHTRVKVKQEDYVRKHRIIFGLNARTVWEVLRFGDPEGWNELMAELPEEFVPWVEDVGSTLSKRKEAVWRKGMDSYNAALDVVGKSRDEVRADREARREFAAVARKFDNWHFVFYALDEDWDKFEEACWLEVKPSADWNLGVDDADHA